MTRVLPEPAPARMRREPSVFLTASRCCSLREERKSVINMPRFAISFNHTNGYSQNARKKKSNPQITQISAYSTEDFEPFYGLSLNLRNLRIQFGRKNRIELG